LRGFVDPSAAGAGPAIPRRAAIRGSGHLDELSDFTQSGGLPEDFRQASGADPLAQQQNLDGTDTSGDASVASAEGAPTPQPQTFKVKVNGKEMELTLEEMTRHAQIALASDGILDTAKAKLKEINELEANIRAQRSGPGHQAGQEAQPTGRDRSARGE
jgi:hypothetical protein